MDLGSGQPHGADRRSGFAHGSDPMLGLVQGRYLGLGLDNQVVPSPSPSLISLPSLDGLDSTDPCHLREVGTGTRLSQGPSSRLFLLSSYKSPVTSFVDADKEGNVTHSWGEDDFKEGLEEEVECVDTHRYGDNLYE